MRNAGAPAKENRSADFQFDEMLPLIVVQQHDGFSRLLLPVDDDVMRAGGIGGEPADRDVINAAPITVSIQLICFKTYDHGNLKI